MAFLRDEAWSDIEYQSPAAAMRSELPNGLQADPGAAGDSY